MTVKLESRLGQLVAKARIGVEAANRQTAEAIARDARQRAPRDSGDLARAIEAKPGDGADWVVTADLWYAHFPEFGTVRTGARPYLTPSAEAHRAAHAAAIRQVYK